MVETVELDAKRCRGICEELYAENHGSSIKDL